ncbi:beta-defensin 1 [Talpa occidentalis]|uniref:beta-defensin 1 n=1 Tax=Talpa occidentalis TaxID=50954 RepID=UPI00188F705E|nr:beta-defensin 1 [Talpa occidentalis]
MRALCCLLLATCLLLCHPGPGMGEMIEIGRRSDHYKCVKKGGTCHYSSCPLNTKVTGTCYNGKAKCCLR